MPTQLLDMERSSPQSQQTDTALRHSEARFQTIAASVPGVIYQFLKHPDGWLTFPFVSPSCREILEVEAMAIEAEADVLFSRIHPEDLEDFNQSVARSSETLQVWQWEGRFTLPSGRLIWLQGAAVPERQENGDILWNGLFMDITARKQAETEPVTYSPATSESDSIREAFSVSVQEVGIRTQQFLNSLLENLPVAVFVKESEALRYVFWNKTSTQLIGYSAREVLGKSGYELFPTTEVDSFIVQDRNVLESGQLLDVPEEYLQTPHRGQRIFRTKKIPILEKAGKPQYLLGIAEDITDRKSAQEQIREQATLLDKSQDAILVLDTQDCIRFCNESAQRLYGWNAIELVGCSSEVLFKDSPQIQQARQTVFATGEWHGELRQVTKNGKEIVVESRWTLVRDQENKPKSILIVNTDITEKKQLEAQFQRAQRLESLGTLAGGMAHDLNNILTPILTSVQILEMVVTDERSQRLLNLLENNAKRGANLIKQVLSFARGTEGEMEVIQIFDLIEEVVKIVKETFPKSIDLFAPKPITELWPICGDATQLHQVLINLCVNARDAMPNGGTLNISAENITIDSHYTKMNIDAKVGRYVVITVADTGCGIPREIIDRIFEPFFTTKEIGKGSGLGLSTVMGIIKGHDGFINAYSDLGKGTRFKIYLPARENREIKSSNSPGKILEGNRELILVVDDEAAICDVTKASLEAYNYRAITANDGLDAIALYARHKNDISAAIVDMMMPSMDGLTTIRTLQKINPQVKVIASSGLLSNVMSAELASTGVSNFLSKPYTAEQLLKTLHQVIGNG